MNNEQKVTSNEQKVMSYEQKYLFELVIYQKLLRPFVVIKQPSEGNLSLKTNPSN